MNVSPFARKRNIVADTIFVSEKQKKKVSPNFFRNIFVSNNCCLHTQKGKHCCETFYVKGRLCFKEFSWTLAHASLVKIRRMLITHAGVQRKKCIASILFEANSSLDNSKDNLKAGRNEDEKKNPLFVPDVH